MVKRKELGAAGEEVLGQAKGANIIDDDIVELDEIVEEPEVFPIGEDLEELLTESDKSDDFEIDIEKLDMELGQDISLDEDDIGEEEEHHAADVLDSPLSILPSEEKPTPRSEPLSAQDSIDELLQQITTTPTVDHPPAGEETRAFVEDSRASAIGREEPVEEVTSPPLDPEAVVREIEEKLAARFEAFVEERLPRLILEAVRRELQSLLKTYEDG